MALQSERVSFIHLSGISVIWVQARREGHEIKFMFRKINISKKKQFYQEIPIENMRYLKQKENLSFHLIWKCCLQFLIRRNKIFLENITPEFLRIIWNQSMPKKFLQNTRKLIQGVKNCPMIRWVIWKQFYRECNLPINLF